MPDAARPRPNVTAATKGLDGRLYPPGIEADINVLAARVLGTPDGQRLMNYLRNITLSVAFPGTVEPNELMHMEGQRYIVGLMIARVKAGSAR